MDIPSLPLADIPSLTTPGGYPLPDPGGYPLPDPGGYPLSPRYTYLARSSAEKLDVLSTFFYKLFVNRVELN